MTKYSEPKLTLALRKIRDEIHREATAVGFDRYYEELNRKSGWLLGQSKKVSRVAVVREKPGKHGK